MKLTLEPSRGRAFTFALCLALVACVSALPASAYGNDPASPLLETGSASKITPAPASSSEIKIVSYNIRWRGSDDIKKLVALLKEDPELGGATIIGLQEVDRNKKRTGNTNTVRLLAEGLGMNYVWAAPPPPERKDKGKKREE